MPPSTSLDASVPTYGLDIETDTTIDGLDPRCAAIVAVSVVGDDIEVVFDGPERSIISRLDATLAELPPGVVITWNGAAFDLPFLADRAERLGLPIGLRLRPGVATGRRSDPLPGHDGAYRATWHAHRHLDGYRLFRNDVGRALRLPCGLKSLARLVGVPAIELDASRIHDASPDDVRAYVTSDARVARVLVHRRWPAAMAFIDPD